MKLLVIIVLFLSTKTIKARRVSPYDYRSIIALCILRVLLRKTYADYEIEMRTDPRICKAFGMEPNF